MTTRIIIRTCGTALTLSKSGHARLNTRASDKPEVCICVLQRLPNKEMATSATCCRRLQRLPPPALPGCPRARRGTCSRGSGGAPRSLPPAGVGAMCWSGQGSGNPAQRGVSVSAINTRYHVVAHLLVVEDDPAATLEDVRDVVAAGRAAAHVADNADQPVTPGAVLQPAV